MKSVVYSLGLGIIGGALGNYLDIPLGWLLGAMAANMVASMQGLSVEVPNWLRTLALMQLSASCWELRSLTGTPRAHPSLGPDHDRHDLLPGDRCTVGDVLRPKSHWF